jgi:DNA-binding NtrC family response regulator
VSASLRVVYSPDTSRAGAAFEVDAVDTSWTFGRKAQVEVADPRLSRAHCRVTRVPEALRVEDLESRNGTFINGRRVTRDYLAPGSVLRLGETLLVFDVGQARRPARRRTRSVPVPELVGCSFLAEFMREWLATVGPATGSVLLLGPSGAGKEVAARAIHRLSGRPGPFVALNCGALPTELADSELFGYRAGAFTGAHEARHGLFVEADGGTLFLDEIGEMGPAQQVKLLRASEHQRIRPLGETKERAVDVRIVAATNADLGRNGFRDDLRARLSQWELRVPPLSERRSDVLVLARHFERGFAAGNTSAARWTTEFMEALLLHDWPLNVRELESLIRRLCVTCREEEVWDVDVLPPEIQRLIHDPEGDRADKEPSRAELESALAEVSGNVAALSQRYKRDRRQMYRWLHRFGLDPDAFRSERG